MQLRTETKGSELGHVGAIFPLLVNTDVLQDVHVEYLGALCSRLMDHTGDMWGFHVPWTFLAFSTWLSCFETTPAGKEGLNVMFILK